MDDRLGRLRELGLRPIVGLVHHGSGPRHTHLADPSFADGLAAFARAVAERYPWIEDYTPVNEPLTTARFSGLYGHWYPHGRDGQTFARAWLTQCRAVVLAMRAIHEVNPAARLIQTEDLGRTFSTPALAYQAEFENERRWSTFDLLCGFLRRGCPWWHYLRWTGVEEAELRWFLDNPCPPDILGINHYLTSERFLDERLGRYPARTHGGNGRHAYADVEAVRVRDAGVAGPHALLGEAWERYQRPLAVTVVHLGCTREEQMRWLLEVGDGACRLRQEGADVRAVTAWSVLGTFDWDCLATRADGRYEPGVFDLRAPSPRPTALAAMVRELASGLDPDHPVLATPGWWRGPERLTSAPEGSAAAPAPAPAWKGRRVRPLAIVGSTGTLGGAFARACLLRGLPARLLSRQELDLTNPASIAAALGEIRPWAVVNAAGYVRVDDAEREPEACWRVNADGPAHLAAACARHGAALLTFSSDLVFDGVRGVRYVESDPVAPLNVYGRCKAEAESRVREALPWALIVRTSAFFGPWDAYNFITIAIRELKAGRPFLAAGDAIISPTYVPDLVHAALDLMIDGEGGLWHLANAGAITCADLARQAARMAGLDAARVEGRPTRALRLAARCPSYSVLDSERGRLLPSLEDALGRYFQECEPDGEASLASRPFAPGLGVPYTVAPGMDLRFDLDGRPVRGLLAALEPNSRSREG